jgi:PAS domain-containing protein
MVDQQARQARAVGAALDFQRLFDGSPNSYLVLDHDLNIATANKAYLASVKRELHDLVGRWAWEAFPTDPETERQAVASFERVIATKQTDVVALLSFGTPRPEVEGGGFDEHYGTIRHTPAGLQGSIQAAANAITAVCN